MMTLLIGGHAPVQGWTDRARATSRILGDRIILWTASESPEDAAAIATADCVHILRCPNWDLAEGADTYATRVARFAQPWVAAVPGIILQLGNEPDVEAGHYGQRIAEMSRAVRSLLPEARIGNAPLSVEKSVLMSADGCDAVLVHTYFERQHPDSITNRTFGQSYVHALEVAAGRPVFVTEFNVVQTNCPIDWPDRNKQAAAWLDMAERDGVAGACFFVLDAAGDPNHAWDSYDVGEEAATEILSLRTPVPAPPPPIVNPPVVVNPGFYTRDTRPAIQRPFDSALWYRFIARTNGEDAAAIIAAVTTNARAISPYDLNLILGQQAVETGNWTSPAWINRRNPAGIAITGDNVQGPDFGTIDRGIKAQLELLSDYYLDARHPWGVLAEFGLGFDAPLGKQTLRDMDGVWAADPAYSTAIADRTNLVIGPITHVDSHYQIVRPVADAIIQGSDGDFSHGGASPGFYAIDFASAIGTPIRAAADGTVREIFWTDSNRVSKRTGHSTFIDHDNGYGTFSCHQTAHYVAAGDRVIQGQIIGTTGDPASQPGNGYGSGPHLHWEIWVGNYDNGGRRVKLEDLEAAGIAGPWGGSRPEDEMPKFAKKLDNGLAEALWNSVNIGKTKAKRIEMFDANHNMTGIATAWRDDLMGGVGPFGAPWGLPLSKEYSASDGRVCQNFTNGIATYVGGVVYFN
jgi:murein DD-endopeptidase MepM/ murein hydrolase activator NlpD